VNKEAILQHFKEDNASAVPNNTNNVLYLPRNIDIRLARKCGTKTLREYFYKCYNIPIVIPIDSITNKVVYSTIFRDNSYKIAVKRDPVAKWVSAYNTVYRERPDLFTLSIDQAVSIRHILLRDNHFASQFVMLGNIKNYDSVFNLENLDSCIDMLNNTLGKDIKIENNNKSTNVLFTKECLSSKQVAIIKDTYSMDYNNGYY
jgi:hypothetical protein